ncbi:hypothetical protein TRIUR3_26575 [Triticum urartu]|uniref:F-box protein AT5G49610-like beta-propeller domain-containing protein n=1 Tax=Triticum urartu TaxID=4572 RepID=M8ALD3_TRIUA|nr:hypothetical protein TRIUR3_26575 [Triticum urartu]
MATEKVLSDDNLLEEILLRLDLPTCLVRASLACSRWLCAVSRPAFLRRFRRLHAPRLLGFYVVGDGVPRQDFVPVSAQLSVLASGASTVQIAKAELPEPPDRIPKLTVLLRGKLYMVTTAEYILGLDLAAASFFVVRLPDGVRYQYFGSMVLSRGYDDHDHEGDHLYLFHVVDRFQLQVWRRRPWTTVADDEAQWVLVHSICLREGCDHLVQQTLVGFYVVGVGENAELAFLEEDSGVVVLLWLGSRTVEKVYQRDPDNDELIVVYPSTIKQAEQSSGTWEKQSKAEPSYRMVQ